MKTMYKVYHLDTTGKNIVVSLAALFRTVGIGGATRTGVMPASVLETLKVVLEKANTSGGMVLGNTGDCKVTTSGDEVTISLAKLPAGRNIVTLSVSYGTNTERLLVIDLIVKSNIYYLDVDGVFTPLTRSVAKDETSEGVNYKAFVYKYGEAVVWLESDKLKTGETVTAFVADSLEGTLEDATEESGIIVCNANVEVYDDDEDISLNVTDNVTPQWYTAGNNIAISDGAISAVGYSYNSETNEMTVGVEDEENDGSIALYGENGKVTLSASQLEKLLALIENE